MLKQKIKKKTIFKSQLRALVIGTVLSIGLFASGIVVADQFDDQIRSLQQQNDSNRQKANQFAAQAASYQDAVDKLSTQINNIRQAILDNQHQSDQLQDQINQQQDELVYQKGVLGKNIKTMYLEGQISTLEILAASKNLSEFVDKQQYRNTVQTKIKTTVEKITQLKLALQEKQRQIQVLIKEQEAQQAQLDADFRQQNDLLSYSEGQKTAYNQVIKDNQAKINELRRQQAIANARLSGGAISGQACDSANGDTYPEKWCLLPRDAVLDSWGMYNRECVSYTAWKVYESGRYMPYWGGRGNANQWDDNARASGIPVDTSPRVGDVGISNYGYYGHSFYVEAVYDDGSVFISDYNQQWDGAYRHYVISAERIAANDLQFIHF
ncbi:CHAP domain-containing protein [Candidatus Saccharibacteria bacterium]|nr:CHAP domain-containing protein [Candidatus Saccharibacteria bacterium]